MRGREIKRKGRDRGKRDASLTRGVTDKACCSLGLGSVFAAVKFESLCVS